MGKRFDKAYAVVYKSFTGADNKSLDIGRILWAQGIYLYFVLSLWSLYNGHLFTPMDWASGFGIALAAGGAALGLKAHAEPRPKRNSEDSPDKVEE